MRMGRLATERAGRSRSLRHCWRVGSLALASAFGPVAGCETETACLDWSLELGSCPSPDEAFVLMSPRACAGEIGSVDGPGVFEDNACCYPITERSGDPSRCKGSSASSGVGGAGGAEPCLPCSAWLADPNAPSSALCPGSFPLAERLVSCACETRCAPACGDNSCAGAPGPPACATCIEEACAAELSDCYDDP